MRRARLIAIVFLIVATSVVADESPRALYDQIVKLNGLLVEMKDQRIPGSDPFSVSLKIKGIEQTLQALAEKGDRSAAFYLGHVRAHDCRYVERALPSSRAVFQSFCNDSVYWYRKAAEDGHYGAAASLANAYRDGEGVAKSALAAIDWYYKAGRLGLEQNDRDFALRMLEEMMKLRPEHVLSRDLYGQLYPRTLDKRQKPPAGGESDIHRM
jgi:TPR repeat protein